MDTILVVDDDPSIQKALRRLFEYEGYNVEVCGDGQSALETLRTVDPKAVILDLGLPVLSGKDVCREIRRATISLPIVVLSAHTNEAEKVLLLDLGADDYVTKPFSPRELLARVHATIRRTSAPKPAESQSIEFGAACVDFATMEATLAGRPVDLTALEFRMLYLLVQNQDRVVFRNEILTKRLGHEGSTQSRKVDNVILKLRQKLETNPAKPNHILTVRGMGYRFAR